MPLKPLSLTLTSALSNGPLPGRRSRNPVSRLRRRSLDWHLGQGCCPSTGPLFSLVTVQEIRGTMAESGCHFLSSKHGTLFILSWLDRHYLPIESATMADSNAGWHTSSSPAEDRLLMVLQSCRPKTHIHRVFIGPDIEILSYTRSLNECLAMEQLSESVVDHRPRSYSQWIFNAAHRSECREKSHM